MKINFLQKIFLTFVIISSLTACFDKQNYITPNFSLSGEEYSKRVAKALYSSIELEYKGKKNLQQLLTTSIDRISADEELKKNAEVVFNNSQVQALFSSESNVSKNGRMNGEDLTTLNLDKMAEQINSSNAPKNVRKYLTVYGNMMSKLKSQLDNNSDQVTLKNEITKTINKFEQKIIEDKKLTEDEKGIIFSMTIPSKDNLGNFISMLEKNSSGAKVKCFFCQLVNALFTVVIVTAVAAIAVIVVVYIGAVATSIAITAGGLLSAGAIASALGGAIAIGSVISDHCISVIDYGQDQDNGTIFGYTSSVC